MPSIKEEIISLAENHMEFDRFLRFGFAAIGIVICIVLLAIAFIHHKKLFSATKSFSCWMGKYATYTWESIRYSNVKYLLLTSLGAYLYTSINLPLTNDEALTYFHFLKCSVSDTMMHYTMPNNHIFFSLIKRLFIWLPGDLLCKMRFPAILCSILMLAFSYRFVRKFYSEKTALVTIAILSMSGMVLFYSSLARGYSLLLLFFVICLYSAFNIVKENNRKKDWFVFSICGAFGFYTMPSFMYPFVAISIYILCYNYRHIKTQIGYGLGTLSLIYLLYLPVLLGSGWQSLFKNPVLIPNSTEKTLAALPGFLSETLELLICLPLYIVIPVILICITFCFYKKDRKTLFLWVLFCTTPPIFIILHSTIPFPRTFIYCSFVIVFLSVVTFREQLGKIPNKILFPLLLVVQCLLFVNFQTNTTLYLRPLAVFNELSKHILQKGKRLHVATANWDNSGFFYSIPNIQFEIERSGSASSLTFSVELKASVDTIHGYDYIFIESHLDETKFRKPLEIYYPDSLESLFHPKPINIYKQDE